VRGAHAVTKPASYPLAEWHPVDKTGCSARDGDLAESLREGGGGGRGGRGYTAGSTSDREEDATAEIVKSRLQA
jgi:hypothetical protein